MAKIGFLGTGAIAQSMVQTLAGDGHDLIVSRRNTDYSTALATKHNNVSIAENAALVEACEIIIVCLTADVARSILADLPFRASHTIISVMAGVSSRELAELCKPVTDVSVMIPLPSLPSGVSPLVAFPKKDVITDLFGSHAQIQFAPSEAALNAHFAATALLLPILTQLNVTANWLANHTGDKAAAENYLSDLLASYFTILAQDTEAGFETMMKGLSVEGGMNDSLAQRLRNIGAEGAIREMLDGFGADLGLKKH